MKYKNLLASIIAALLLLSGLHAQSLKPGTVTFQNINGKVTSQNINTGLTEEITAETLLTEGFNINTSVNSYLDVVFSNGVVSRLSPNSKLEIESFAVTGGRGSRDTRMNLRSTRSMSMATEPVLKLKLEFGDVIVNSTEKNQGDLIIATPTAEVTSDLAKFFLSHGSTTSESQNVSRAINLGSNSIQISSNLQNNFTENNNQVSYGFYDSFADLKTKPLYTDASVIILSAKETTNISANYDDVIYSLIPFDTCMNDRLGEIADFILLGGNNPTGYIVVTAADLDSTYFNVISGEVDSIRPGMTLAEGSIIRTSVTGTVSAVFPNGVTMVVDPASNVYLDSISTQPVLSGGTMDNQTNILVRVETGRIVTNTINSPATDTFEVISPLDKHIISADTVVAVEFLQIDTNAFQTVSQNQTPNGTNGINTTVVTSNNLSFVSDTVTFIEYATGGDFLTFSTPPEYTHITESAIIPPSYDFIDRTIAFAAGVIAGPTPVGTPGNPGNDIRTSEPDGVSP